MREKSIYMLYCEGRDKLCKARKVEILDLKKSLDGCKENLLKYNKNRIYKAHLVFL